MNFLDKFLSQKKNVIILVMIKLSISGYLLYLFFQADVMAKKIIILSGVFIMLMAMAPVLLIYFLQKKQKEKKAKDENKNI